MSIRHSILALLRREPMHGYQLRAAFEASTGGTWPLNIGQIYTTLGRLERDGFVRPLPETESGQRPYLLTTAGESELVAWFDTPVERAGRPRDEMAIKLALALTTPKVDIPAVIQRQRTATMRVLQEYTRVKPAAECPEELPWLLVLDALLFQAEAEIRWLDHCEARLARHPVQHPAPPSGSTAPAPATVASVKRS
ncbi:MAG: PadR family transcriptional regulator [Dactylosporangium sp.]|nr:PadR family transcriptional regulator [Dactylosporangium sp.]NNJ59958.1 PadR family transcriptional regulator [Dactylosporangium sp.]